MSSTLEYIYRSARYWVRRGGNTVRILVDQRNPSLDRLLGQVRAHRWGLITAWNPRSRVLPPWRNQGHDAVLLRELQRNGYRVLRASSDGPDYPAELGFLVLDIDPDGIAGFGREYRQNAVLAGRRGAKARLVWCGGPRQCQQTLEKYARMRASLTRSLPWHA